MPDIASTILWLRLLGGCDIEQDGIPLRLESTKTQALLVYLALNSATHTRSRLAGLFWSDIPEDRARRNLRHALWDIRRKLTNPTILVADRETVQVDDHRITSDVYQFEAASRALNDKPPADIPHLAAGVAHYGGDFLEGFYINDAPLFEEWVLAERERLRMMMIRALEHLVSATAESNPEFALAHAQRLLAIEPWHENAHRQLMALYAATGQPTKALAQYEAYRDLLHTEFGVEPSAQTTELYTSIKAARVKTDAPIRRVPHPANKLVGRDRELAQINEALDKAECRLLTLTGPGGIGKSRLAIAVARHRPAPSNGVIFVSLAKLHDAVGVAAEILRAFDVLTGSDSHPIEHVIAYMRSKQLLLVLDNCEHLLDAGLPALSARLVSECPGVQCLVTSRERLNLYSEWVLPLEGLTFPEVEFAGNAGDFAAVQLFAQTARRVRLDFMISADNTADIAAICRNVAGMPLGIELAAAWTRALSCAEIRQQLELQHDLPSDTWRDYPERHNSLRRVFAQSWAWLHLHERVALSCLSVFSGGFDARDAAAVGVDLRVLLALVDKSLIQRGTDGRYGWHPLLKAFAAEKLALDERTRLKTEAEHAEHYLSPPPTPIAIQDRIADITADLVNIRTAWRWAASHRQLSLLQAYFDTLYTYFEIITDFRSGEAVFAEALQLLGWSSAGELAISANVGASLAWQLLARQSAFAAHLGDLDAAAAALETCQQQLAKAHLVEEIAFSLLHLGDVYRFQGKLDLAQQHLESSLALYREAGNQTNVAFCLNILGLVAIARQEPDRSLALLEESLSLFQSEDHRWGQIIAQTNLGLVLTSIDELESARHNIQASMHNCQTLGHRWGYAVCLSHLANIAAREGDERMAIAQLQESLDILQEIGQIPSAERVSKQLAELQKATRIDGQSAVHNLGN